MELAHLIFKGMLLAHHCFLEQILILLDGFQILLKLLLDLVKLAGLWASLTCSGSILIDGRTFKKSRKSLVGGQTLSSSVFVFEL